MRVLLENRVHKEMGRKPHSAGPRSFQFRAGDAGKKHGAKAKH